MTVVDLARELGTTDRTLRRLAEVGTIRSTRARGGSAKAVLREAPYLESHWQLLRQLRAALRTEPKVVAALLFGSVARGEDTPASDVDLVVALDGDPTLVQLNRLRKRIARKLDRTVDLFNLDDLVAQPELLDPIIDEARPVVDRASVWPRLLAFRRRRTRRGRTTRRLPRRVSTGWALS
jgi:predicted nucleotidyltransferase